MKKILLVLSTLALLSCGGSGFRNGQNVTVTQRCIWASTEETYKTMSKLCNRKDEAGLELMEWRGEVGILGAGEQGVVTDTGFGKVKIRLPEGIEVWVASEFLR